MHMFLQYVACQTPLQAEEVELFSVKGHHNSNDDKLTDHPSPLMNDLDSVPLLLDPCQYDLQILQAEETLAGIKANCTSSRDRLVSIHRKGLVCVFIFTNCMLKTVSESYIENSIKLKHNKKKLWLDLSL